MGEYRNTRNIRFYKPDSDESTFYIAANHPVDMADIIFRSEAHFRRNLTVMDIQVHAENIQTSHLGYDLHDPADYTNYLVVTLADAA